MKVLIAVASRHGSTKEIADELGRALSAELTGRGMTSQVDVMFADKVRSVAEYDAVVLGSAVYRGQWLDSAKGLAERHRGALLRKPVWLFSSGPVGDPLKPAKDPVDVSAVVALVGARKNRVFSGKIDKQVLRFAERAIMTALRVKEGDYRDWAAVREWASQVAEVLGHPHALNQETSHASHQ
ncbi:flavodoxin domain-containing protein [Amycolatopsis sp. H20-H5]|uniref:flavodoxin domain-containing protein n=1 Tax=Amycolatopsis sp. H20-H5 TaxID=3046309 RepID=UPI002DBBEC49|nr:flavodoxin domain-containing protein [Amycolatopsis sp. H20-H5]MEC3982601.1 flavodoxin domain-containing protein [Amycolatopsis sp. H20-H5]